MGREEWSRKSPGNMATTTTTMVRFWSIDVAAEREICKSAYTWWPVQAADEQLSRPPVRGSSSAADQSPRSDRCRWPASSASATRRTMVRSAPALDGMAKGVARGLGAREMDVSKPRLDSKTRARYLSANNIRVRSIRPRSGHDNDLIFRYAKIEVN